MMTRNEAIRTIGDMFAFAGAKGYIDGGPAGAATIFAQAVRALGVTREEAIAVAVRASAELRDGETNEPVQ